ncbi:hypothetical protein [Helicobacter pylori]|nr:hypothetical protein [Helicobacter pylori]
MYYSSEPISCFLAFFSVWAVLLASPFCGVGSADRWRVKRLAME